MAGPGSRLEKVGTIFSRVQGLLRSGALKEREKPIWYEVYAKFPPTTDLPQENEEHKSPKDLLYKEDLVRGKFYRTYGNADVIDMQSQSDFPLSQRFIDAYFEIKAKDPSAKGKIFEAAAEALKNEGVRLKTLEEIEKEKQELVAKRIAEASNASDDISKTDAAFGTVTPADEAEDTLDEDILNPDYEKLNKEK